MNNKQFIKYITDNSNCTLKDARVINLYFTGALSTAIAEGHEVEIDNLGKFALKTSKSKSKNQNVPCFIPDKKLRASCN